MGIPSLFMINWSFCVQYERYLNYKWQKNTIFYRNLCLSCLAYVMGLLILWFSHEAKRGVEFRHSTHNASKISRNKNLTLGSPIPPIDAAKKP